MSSSTDKQDYPPRRMTECDVIRYTLNIPEDLKTEIANEAEMQEMDMSSYICGVLAGDIKRPDRKTAKKSKKES
jgi:hypothetical protein